MAESLDEKIRAINEWLFRTVRHAVAAYEEQLDPDNRMAGEPAPQPPPQLIQLLTKAHACFLAMKRSHVVSASDFDKMSPQDKLLELKKAEREIEAEIQAQN